MIDSSAAVPTRRLGEIPPTTRVEQVCKALLEGILSGAILPGMRLVESTLSHQLGVSQATVNQALQDLHAQGLVCKSPNRGTTVAAFGVAELEALFSVRAVLDCIAVEAASRNITASSAASLRRWIEQMRTASKSRHLAEFYLADYEFHQELYRLSKNRFLIQACQAVASAPFAYILCDRPQPLAADYSRIANDHEEIVKALLKGPREAGRAMKAKTSKWLNLQRECLGGGRAQRDHR